MINTDNNKKDNNEDNNEDNNTEEINKGNKENIQFENNNCKKLFYIDENLKINCIYGDLCINEYPHLNKNIKNLCTNCIVKYKNKCYLDCPENTYIKQDINLDTCIDIEPNTKVINRI